MRVRVSALWDQVASRLGPGNVDAEAVQRAVLRAAGYAWCVPLPRTRVACTRRGLVTKHALTRHRLPGRPLPPSPSPFRRDDVTGELTGWPRDVAVSPGPEARPSASPTRGAACAPVDLTSPDDAARRDDDDATREREPRGDATPRDGPDPISALPSLTSLTPHKGVSSKRKTRESPVVSIAISDSEDSEDAEDATRKRGRGDEDDVADVAASRRAPKDSGSPSRPPPRAPSFARASSAQLERELAKHGMKPGPREYMTRELARAWAAGAALPPDFFEPEAEASTPSTRRAEAEAPSPRRCRTGGRSDSADGELENALGRFIKSNVALYERVLLMETVDVDEVLATVRRAPAPLAPGIAAAKVPRAKLLAYLEREGVAVTHTSGRRARATRTRF